MDSRAFKILSMYSDSDVEEESSPQHSAQPNTQQSADPGEIIGQKLSKVDTGESSASVLIERIEEVNVIISNEAIEARQSLTERPRRTSDWISDEENIDLDDNDDDAVLKEPPPPPRPADFRTCSPSPAPVRARRSPTPAPASAKSGRNGVPRVESKTLVSYEIDGDTAAEISVSSEKRPSKDAIAVADAGVKVADADASVVVAGSDGDESADDGSSVGGGGAKTSENTPSTGGAADDLDAYALLDKCLEKGNGGGGGGESPFVFDRPIELPAEPREKCSAELHEEFVEHFYKKIKTGYDFNAKIQQLKDFRNPSMYEKLVEHLGLDELGSNFPPSLSDPHGFKPTDYYDEIAKAQRAMMDKLEKEKPTATAAAKDSSAAAAQQANNAGGDDLKRRRSKWDNPPPPTQPSESAKTKN